MLSYCESVSASGNSKWHLRNTISGDRMLGGGINTPSLCGFVRPPYGWDLVTLVSTMHDKHTCKHCLIARDQR